MRRAIAFILTLSLIFALSPMQTFAAKSQELVLLEQQKEIFKDGEIIGTTYRTITRTIIDNKILLNTKEINNFNDGSVTENSDVTTIEVINENEAEINGEKYDLNEVIYSDSSYENTPMNQRSSYTVLGSGGRYSYITWEDRYTHVLLPTPYTTTMTTASGIKNRLSIDGAMFLDTGGAKDDAITKSVLTDGPNKLAVINFKHYAGDVVAARNTININAPLLMAALGLTVLTAASVVGAIGGAIGVAGFAAAIWSAGSDANSSMGSAYAILQSI